SERRVVVVSLRFSTMVSILGRSVDIIACASTTVGITFVFTSAASSSMRWLLLRIARYIASRTPACRRTAIPVRATNNDIWSIRSSGNHQARTKEAAGAIRATDSWRFLYPPSPRDTPGVQLRTRPGPAPSAGSPLRGHDQPTAQPVPALPL